MSATMDLLKGGKKPPADSALDQELGEPAAAPEVETVEDEGDGETTEQAEADAVEEEQAETEAAGEDTEAAVGVAVPTTKTEVHALKVDQLDPVHAALGSPIANFAKLSMKAKKEAIMGHLFPQKSKKLTENDPVIVIAKEIEAMDTRAKVEAEIAKIETSSGLNDFRLGGLLIKLQEIGDFGEHTKFADYVEATFSKGYRTARYLMANYTGLLELGIPADEIAEIGWTKLEVLLRLGVLSQENYQDWKLKATKLTVKALTAEAEAAAAKGAPDAKAQDKPQNDSTFKTKSFKLINDQIETVSAALEKAKKNGGTTEDNVALDYICTEYLANATGSSKPKAAPKAAELVAPGYDEDTLDLGAFFAAVAKKYPDPKEAMGFLFGTGNDGAETSFFEDHWGSTVEISINVP